MRHTKKDRLSYMELWGTRRRTGSPTRTSSWAMRHTKKDRLSYMELWGTRRRTGSPTWSYEAHEEGPALLHGAMRHTKKDRLSYTDLLLGHEAHEEGPSLLHGPPPELWGTRRRTVSPTRTSSWAMRHTKKDRLSYTDLLLSYEAHKEGPALLHGPPPELWGTRRRTGSPTRTSSWAMRHTKKDRLSYMGLLLSYEAHEEGPALLHGAMRHTKKDLLSYTDLLLSYEAHEEGPALLHGPPPESWCWCEHGGRTRAITDDDTHTERLQCRAGHRGYSHHGNDDARRRVRC